MVGFNPTEDDDVKAEGKIEFGEYKKLLQKVVINSNMIACPVAPNCSYPENGAEIFSADPDIVRFLIPTTLLRRVSYLTLLVRLELGYFFKRRTCSGYN